MGGVRDACGVSAFISNEVPAALPVAVSLMTLQHRGQESAGIGFPVADSRVEAIRGMGLVGEVLNPTDMAEREETTAIGHVRYSTRGGSHTHNIQPFRTSSKLGDILVAHNGTISNLEEVREEYIRRGWVFLSTSDTEVLARMVAEAINETNEPISAFKRALSRLQGSWSLCISIGSKLFAIRDPLGFRPLTIGRMEGPDGSVVAHMAASESPAIEAAGGEVIREVRPGEVVELFSDCFQSHDIMDERHCGVAHCFFEWVYFARPDSVIGGKLVRQRRDEVGRCLAREHRVDADIVVPVPDSGRAHAVGYSAESGIPLREGLVKNRHVARTFISPGQKERGKQVRRKLIPIPEFIAGKRVILVDDSIVRGTTMGRIVSLVRDAGALEVHVRIGSPPIVGPCYFGIDMAERDQFITSRHQDVEGVAKEIGADSLGHISRNGLYGALGFCESDLCTGCITESYPIVVGDEKVRGCD